MNDDPSRVGEVFIGMIKMLQAADVPEQRIIELSHKAFDAFWERRLLNQFNGLISRSIAEAFKKALSREIHEICSSTT